MVVYPSYDGREFQFHRGSIPLLLGFYYSNRYKKGMQISEILIEKTIAMKICEHAIEV